MKIRVNKSKLNLIIDIIMFVVLMAITGIGFMIKYILVPGYKRNDIYGRDVELYFWGLDRHKWGGIHLYLSFILLMLLLLHIAFHWKQIILVLKRMIPKKAMRIAFTFGLIVISFVLGILPLLVKPEIQETGSHNHKQSEPILNLNAQKPDSITRLKPNKHIGLEPTDISPPTTDSFRNKDKQGQKHAHNENKDIEVYGYMTINDVAKKYNLSATELARYIHLPEASINEKLGRLRKQYDFELNDLRNYIESSVSQHTTNSQKPVMEAPIDIKNKKQQSRESKTTQQ